jgi:hypothetical protein
LSGVQSAVRLGFIGPLTGGPAAKGLGGRNSALLAVRQRSERTAARYRYELVVADDACDPAVGARVAEAMARDPSIVAGVTHYCSQVALACVDLYHRHGFPVVVWGAHAAEITAGNDYPEIHRVSGTFANEDDAAARFMRQRGLRTWAILHDPTHYGVGHARTLAGCLQRQGGEVRRTFELSIDQQDMRAEIGQVQALGVDAVYVATAPSAWWTTHGGVVELKRPPTDVPGWMPTPAHFARQAAELGLRAQLHCIVRRAWSATSASSQTWDRRERGRSPSRKARRLRRFREAASLLQRTPRRASASRPTPSDRVPTPPPCC